MSLFRRRHVEEVGNWWWGEELHTRPEVVIVEPSDDVKDEEKLAEARRLIHRMRLESAARQSLQDMVARATAGRLPLDPTPKDEVPWGLLDGLPPASVA